MDQVPEGQSFIHLTPDGSFRRLSPFKLQREMDLLIGPCVNAKVIRSGNILIRVFNKDQARLALSITTFCGTAVTAAPATRLNTVAGTCYSPALQYIEEAEIQAELRSQGVVEVTRLRSKGPNPNPLLKLRFLGLECPPAVYAGYEVLTVSPWEVNPRLCRRCGRYGHLQSTCRSKKANCLRCATLGHSSDECQSEEVQCAHCGGPHPAWDKKCPAWHFHKEKLNRKSPSAPPPRPAGHSIPSERRYADAVRGTNPRCSGPQAGPGQRSDPNLTPPLSTAVELPRPSHTESTTETVTAPVPQTVPTLDETDTVTETPKGAAQPLAEVPTETQPFKII
ncbi:uncharacterized protein LOC122375717 [Amphibalanus amphitrite]|uniref:uncharacterized protein LOC122375717 n=1 Tax=Amphibalanus amphitrite TaxID=1232801 RepID=UPI001C920389|nr:uncharacterized protein LOC122375717 [Amphibalanus amphitrite]